MKDIIEMLDFKRQNLALEYKNHLDAISHMVNDPEVRKSITFESNMISHLIEMNSLKSRLRELRELTDQNISIMREKELLKMYEAAVKNLQTIHKEKVKELDMQSEAKTSKRKGRPKAEYICAISKHVCPFNDDFWELGNADAAASDNCPIQSYENSNRIESDGTKVINDWCKNLIPRT